MPEKPTPDPGPPEPTDLRVEYETEPINVAPEEPRFSWRAEAGERGARQTAYRVLVARSADAVAERRGDAWDSGRIESDASTNVPYDGAALRPDAEYYWTVRVWDGNGEASEWADPASFSTALGSGREWAGDWIGYRPGAGDSNGYRSRWRSVRGDPVQGADGAVADAAVEGDTDSGADATEWVQVDLGETRTVDRVELHPANPFDGPETPDGMRVSSTYSHEKAAGEKVSVDGPSGFGFPAGYRVEVAADPDFEESRVVADRTGEANPGVDPVTVDVGGDARYVRVVATDLYEFDPAETPVIDDPQIKPELLREEFRPWRVFALAAIAVRDGAGEDLATDRPVTASSSVEDGSWGREHLVDGRYRSRSAPGAALLRTEVDLSKDVERARAHVCALGYGELYVNGERVGDDVLNPGWTQYDQRALYSTYDVTERLDAGENAVGLHLGRGWFDRNVRDWTGFGAPRAIAQVNVEYEDGTTRSIATDSSWRAGPSPILSNDVYDGEAYDARRESPGWADRGFDASAVEFPGVADSDGAGSDGSGVDRGAAETGSEDAAWTDARVVAAPGGDLVPQRTPPIRVTETIDPVEITEREDGPIVDFGQNLVGWVKLTIEGAAAGDEIELTHAEALREDGSLSLIDLRSADATDVYVARGDDAETYEPRFTYHGFRYAQIRGYPGEIDPEDVRAKVVHTDVEPIGEFDCSNEDLSQVQHNAEWGLRGNLHGVLTDCPQRDERFGWTGDNHIAARALMYNFDSVRFHEKWMDDHDDVQSEHGYLADTIPYGFGSIPEGPTWGITRVTIPWQLYRHYGDVGVLERHYDGMRRYVDYWYEQMDGGVLPEEYGNYGDWLAFENAEGRRGLPHDLFNTAFQYRTTERFARIAEALGREDDADRYAARADEIAAAFNREFLDDDAATYGPGTQSSYAVPLFFGLVPDDRVDAVVDNLVEKVRSDGGKLRTGFLGTRPLIHALAEHGRADVAYEIVSQPERPGWVYMARQGATTMWERWDSDDRVGDGMNSFNHSPFTFVSEWFYRALAGLRFDDSASGAGGVEIAPAIVDDLDWASGAVETVDGRLSSHWERTDGGYVLDVEVPWNTDGTIRLPTGGGETRVVESGETVWDGDADESTPAGVESVRLAGEAVEVTVGAGSYRFDVSR